MLTEQQIRNDIFNLDPELIPAYIISRVREFEKLRVIYERDIQTFKDIAKQAGINADRDIQRAVSGQLRVVNNWWGVALQKASGVEIAEFQMNSTGDVEKAAEDFVAIVLANLENVIKYRIKREVIDVEGGEQQKQLGGGL